MKNIDEFVKKLDLPEYHTRALTNLLILGKTKPQELAKISDVPRTRIYDVLEDLFKIGLVKKTPHRPSVYHAIELKNITKNLMFWKEGKLKEEIKNLKTLEKEVEKIRLPKYDSKSIELLRIVQVGVPSELETVNIIQTARKEICIVSRAFEYYPKIEGALTSAYKRDLLIRLLLLNSRFLEERDKKRQEMIIQRIKRDMPRVEIKISKEKLPIRTTIADASKDYSSGSAVFSVEQTEVPLFMREAAITTNASLVYGLKVYFDSLWKDGKSIS